MNEQLRALLNDADAFRAHISGLDLAGLLALETEIRDEGRAIAQIGANDLTTEDLGRLRTLKDSLDAVREQRTERETAAQQAAADIAAFNTEPDPAPEPVPTPDPTPVPEPVTAGAAPRVGDVARTSPRVPANVVGYQFRPDDFAEYVVDPDSQAGYGSWRDVAKRAERQLASYNGLRGNGKHTIAELRRNFDPELTSKGDDDEALVKHAVDMKRLPEGALTAAAGWCAPSQTIYDLCELETADGMVDLPEVQITRGGLRFTPGPDFASIFGGAGFFHQTEAQVIANTPKPCMEIACPPFTDIRLEVEGVCITGSILQRRGYPELVERFIRGAMVAHMHRLNAFVIAQLVAGSDVVDLNPPTDIPLDVSATSHTLSAVEMQAMDLRYRNRLGENAMLEAVFPIWGKALFRADLSRRQGLAEFQVTDAMINEWLASRGVRAQWVYDWQDAFSGLAAGPGGAVPLTLWPNSMFFLIYPAGTWLRGSDDTIRLETIYDSANLATNRYTALFTEEGVLVAEVCNGGSRIVEVQVCPNGITAAPVAFVCA